MKQAEILIPSALDHGFDYELPQTMALAPGDLVSVPLGKKHAQGVVWREGSANLAAGKIKLVTRKYDFPPLSAAIREFIDWAAWYNCMPRGMVLKMVLPIKDLEKKGRASRREGREEKNIYPDPRPLTPDPSLAHLSATQEAAATNLKSKLKKEFSVTLLDGVTGSGKTEVYFDAIAATLSRQSPVASRQNSAGDRRLETGDSQVLVLLPEIALSVQWHKRFEERFGFKPVVWNSEITSAQKRENWKAIVNGDARVVVGARSALFLPYKHLSLIVIDEEHDQSYKQEEGVIYHARDMAVARARFEKFPVVLVSATPSLESYHNARQGKYDEVILPVRHAEAVMPDIEMIDMKQAPLERGAFISEPLRQALTDTLRAGHQAMLFLNRRGYAPLMLCRKCGHRFQCPDCSSWMVLHKKGLGGRGSGVGNKEKDIFSQTPILTCHHCNFHIPAPDTCPACGTKDTLHACGPGVERIYEEAKAILPDARIEVLASDSTTSYKVLSGIINDMIHKKIDVLVGTQMIAKGHHFADLGVVGVIDADLGLGGGDLRASERTYQLLHQLSGRAGREQIRGKVYLQSFLPEHPVMKALISGDREAFLSAELQARKNAKMPPFTRLAAIIVEGAKEEEVLKISRLLASTHHPSPTTHLLGPAPAPLYRLHNRYRMRLLLKAERNVNLPDYIRQWVAGVDVPRSVRVRVDVDPVSFL